MADGATSTPTPTRRMPRRMRWRGRLGSRWSAPSTWSSGGTGSGAMTGSCARPNPEQRADRTRGDLGAGPGLEDAAPRAGPIGRMHLTEVVRRLCGVQAQVASSAELAVRLRSEAVGAGDVGRALADGDLIKTWAMRGTLHLLTPEDAGRSCRCWRLADRGNAPPGSAISRWTRRRWRDSAMPSAMRWTGGP